MAWNMMGGQIEWAALPVIVEIIGVSDVESMVVDLLRIREHMTSKAE